MQTQNAPATRFTRTSIFHINTANPNSVMHPLGGGWRTFRIVVVWSSVKVCLGCRHILADLSAHSWYQHRLILLRWLLFCFFFSLPSLYFCIQFDQKIKSAIKCVCPIRCIFCWIFSFFAGKKNNSHIMFILSFSRSCPSEHGLYSGCSVHCYYNT